ncbi:MAG: hypothetical protein JKY08_02075 [Flavobacteriaceae bacterium]|nr:hypothetical protein [Flavobacteriaceae bacterium]
MKYILKFFLISLIIVLTSCGALGTKTLYKSEGNLKKPTIIGFSQVVIEDMTGKIVQGNVKIYDSVMTSELTSQNIHSKKIVIDDFDGFDSINSGLIKSICSRNQLDGIILTQLKFFDVKYTSMFIPIGQSKDTEVEMHYYDRNGKLLLHTKHNTHKGNSYWNSPAVSKTITDGTKGALGRILKEMGK